MNIKTYKDLVREVLRKYEDARNSRSALFVRLCQERGLKIQELLSESDLVKLKENIDLFFEKDADRRRREIQNGEHLYPPTPEVSRQRSFFATGQHI